MLEMAPVTLADFIAAPAPPGIHGNATAVASATIPNASIIAPFAFPSFTLATKDATPLAKENMSHAVSETSPVGSV